MNLGHKFLPPLTLWSRCVAGEMQLQPAEAQAAAPPSVPVGHREGKDRCGIAQ